MSMAILLTLIFYFESHQEKYAKYVYLGAIFIILTTCLYNWHEPNRGNVVYDILSLGFAMYLACTGYLKYKQARIV
jgi:hypothetical protein